jgi:hypothetical protein
MAEPDNIVLEHLRHIRGVIDAIRDDMADIKSRMTTLEFSVGNLIAIEANHYAGHSGRLDRIDARLDRIERRLELADA